MHKIAFQHFTNSQFLFYGRLLCTFVLFLWFCYCWCVLCALCTLQSQFKRWRVEFNERDTQDPSIVILPNLLVCWMHVRHLIQCSANFHYESNEIFDFWSINLMNLKKSKHVICGFRIDINEQQKEFKYETQKVKH